MMYPSILDIETTLISGLVNILLHMPNQFLKKKEIQWMLLFMPPKEQIQKSSGQMKHVKNSLKFLVFS
jgi:hypothetical protein